MYKLDSEPVNRWVQKKKKKTSEPLIVETQLAVRGERRELQMGSFLMATTG
jgi:hypothetical protein